MEIESLKFRISEEKAIEAVVWIANEWRGITPFYLSKVLFYAEKEHINKFGRPLIADTYIAMPYGPVPSTVRDYVEGNHLFSDLSHEISESIEVDRSGRYPEIRAKRSACLDVFSETDIDCLKSALQLCRHASFATLSGWTHLEKAWLSAPANGPMDYLDFIDTDNPNREQIIEQAREFAAFGVL